MTVETVDTVLPVPGPSPTNDGQSYIARKPVTSGDTPVAEIGSPVTVSVQYPKRPEPITISFLLGCDHALPWIDYLTKGLCLNGTATLHPDSADHSPVVTVKLLSMSPSHQQEPTSLREEADNLRQEGNEIFKTSKVFREYKSAVQKYAKALDRSRLAGANPEFETKLYSNIALCQLRMGEWTNSISNSDVVLSRNPDDPKALYRRALVNVELDHPVRAIADFRHAANAAPEDAAVKRELIRVEKEFAQVMAKHRQQFAEVYNVMLHSDVFKQPIPE